MTEQEIIKTIRNAQLCSQPDMGVTADNISLVLGLKRVENGWALVPIEGAYKKREYTTVIELPEWLWAKPYSDSFFESLYAFLAIKLTQASRAIKSNANRTAEQRRASAVKAIGARWNKVN